MFRELIKVRRRRIPVLSLSDRNRLPRRDWGRDHWREEGWAHLYSIREPFSRKLSPEQRRVLSAILDGGCLSQSDVAKALDMRICDVSNHLKRIEKKLARFCQPKVSKGWSV